LRFAIAELGSNLAPESNMRRISRLTFLHAAFALAFSFIFMAGGTAQTRLSYKDLEQRIKNLNGDSKNFSPILTTPSQQGDPQNFTGKRCQETGG
jgi:hypothetical protein